VSGLEPEDHGVVVELVPGSRNMLVFPAAAVAVLFSVVPALRDRL
jgi:hypothetical protein